MQYLWMFSVSLIQFWLGEILNAPFLFRLPSEVAYTAAVLRVNTREPHESTCSATIFKHICQFFCSGKREYTRAINCNNHCPLDHWLMWPTKSFAKLKIKCGVFSAWRNWLEPEEGSDSMPMFSEVLSEIFKRGWKPYRLISIRKEYIANI